MTRRAQLGLLAVIAASTPAALGLEGLLRKLYLPEIMSELRDWLRPQLEPVSWTLVVLGVLTVALALQLQPRLYQSVAARQPRARPEGERRMKARWETMLVVTSIPQLPALVATILYTFGAPAIPTVAAVAVGTVGVLIQWLRLRELGVSARPGCSSTAGTPPG